MTEAKHENPRLARQPSPYLRGAAHQPVQWYAWSDDAFQAAKTLDRPILLDIGAVWCHWCHVMDGESYDNTEIAKIINERFVPVKVDRDERPDVDARYQRLVGGLTGQGGWPLTGFLLPDGQVFWGGTYFPPKAAQGRPGFPEILNAVADAYRDKRPQVQEQAAHLSEHAFERKEPAAAGAVTSAWTQERIQDLYRHHDPSNGGWGGAPKFPHPSAVEFLLVAGGADATAREMAELTLQRMAEGGVRDHVGGGFHRYSVDAEWIVPHFEKMLYDNSELLRNYVLAYAVTGKEAYAEVARETARFVREVLTDPLGGFCGSQDADVAFGDDGDFFTWTRKEVADAVGDERRAKVAWARFGVEAKGQMHHHPAKNVLHVVADEETLTEVLRTKKEAVVADLARVMTDLRTARARRKAPFVDPVLYTNWNGMAIRAMFEYSGACSDADAASLARRAMDRFLKEAFEPRTGFRRTLNGQPLPGLLDDQAQMLAALCVAFNHTQSQEYLERAQDVARLLVKDFWDAERSAFRDVPVNRVAASRVLAQADYPMQDSPSPSANARAAEGLRMLAALTGNGSYAESAARLCVTWAADAARLSLFGCGLQQAVHQGVAEPPKIVVAGPPGAFDPLLRAALSIPWPGLTVLRADASTVGIPAEAVAFAKGPALKEAAALICIGQRCLAPIKAPSELKARLRDALSGRAAL